MVEVHHPELWEAAETTRAKYLWLNVELAKKNVLGSSASFLARLREHKIENSQIHLWILNVQECSYLHRSSSLKTFPRSFLRMYLKTIYKHKLNFILW